MRYFEKMPGERLYLSPMNIDDAVPYTKWMNDSSVTDNLGGSGRNISLDAEEKALVRMANEGHNYAIVLREDDTLIGNISLMNINTINRSATLGIFIGDQHMRGKGYGREAIDLILRYGFLTLNLHNIMLEVHADNEAGIRCYQKAGFKECGRRRDACYKNGHYVDLIQMDILDSEVRK